VDDISEAAVDLQSTFSRCRNDREMYLFLLGQSRLMYEIAEIGG